MSGAPVWSVLLVFGALLGGCGTEAPLSAPVAAAPNRTLAATVGEPAASPPAPALSPTRLLRRLSLSLRGREPDVAEYEAMLAAEAAGAVDAHVDDKVTAYLESDEFAEQMLLFGFDLLRVGDYKRGSIEGNFGAAWKGGMSIRLQPCPANTLHSGRLGHFDDNRAFGDPVALCSDSAARVDEVEPWWAPGTTVSTIGRAGNGARAHNGTDCGIPVLNQAQVNHYADPSDADPGCGCGPNLVYCHQEQVYGTPPFLLDRDSNPYFTDAQRRLLFEEPARLFAHVVVNDRPYSDLVTGDYTVAPRKLQHAYVRWARMSPDNVSLDDSTWWREATDSWDEVLQSSLHPNLLDDRGYTFDPRTDDGDPAGIPAAGVLTLLAPNSWFPRERVRAARWLETFACREFAAPDPSTVFPPFTGDPYATGSCLHCHTTIDPAAIHFKRLEIEESVPRHAFGYPNLGGVGGWSWRRKGAVSFADPASPGGIFWFQPYGRWHMTFQANTFLTPVSQERIDENADARFLDFLPPGSTLFGFEGDGTIGPLGFGKILVESGEFDRCAARRVFERVMGRRLDIVGEAALHRELTEVFRANDRRVKALIRHIVARDELRRGL